jgi:hypothetical protein
MKFLQLNRVTLFLRRMSFSLVDDPELVAKIREAEEREMGKYASDEWSWRQLVHECKECGAHILQNELSDHFRNVYASPFLSMGTDLSAL